MSKCFDPDSFPHYQLLQTPALHQPTLGAQKEFALGIKGQGHLQGGPVLKMPPSDAMEVQ